MKRQHVLKSMLCLILGLVCNVAWAALGNKTGTPENGKKYYIYADTYQGGAYVNRYLYNNNGTLALSTTVDEVSGNYLWTCTVANGKHTFQNVGDNTKWLGHKALATSAYNFTLGKTNANHEGTTIWSDGASRYLVTKNDGSTFDQAQNTYNQTSGDWCTDYVFVEYVAETGYRLSVTTNAAGAGNLLVNGESNALPYSKGESALTFPVTLTAEANNPYKFVGFFVGNEDKGTSVTINSLEAATAYEARFALNIFSASTAEEDLIPVQVYNNRDKGYSIKMNAADSYAGKAVNSGSCSFGENEIWYLVGTAESFKMYCHTAGTSLAITLASANQNAETSLTANGTDLCLVEQADGSFGICPKSNQGQSFNMHSGVGKDIKLFDTSDGGSKWLFRRINLNGALTLQYNTQLEGGYEQNYKIGELSINIAGTESKTMLTRDNIPASSTCYLPEGAVFGISKGFMCHGWTMDFNGAASIDTQALPAKGLTVNVNIAVDKNNKYQYLYYSPGPGGHPYRIPALATTANGYVFAINDYRPCGNDIGYGEVDLVMRHSVAAGNDWDGHTWTPETKIADGLGHTNEGIWRLGFGDPAIVADRENNEILVMSVCGNRTCWDGNYGEGGDNENPNRMARLYITFDEEKKKWVVGEPEEVTYDIYPLFKDANGGVHAASMFIGAGRIAQSSKIKVGTHYRIYCAVWTVTKDIRQHHNYALYSDDFGKTWHLLGDLGYDNSPSKWGNEPKCEELPDGSVLLSSRKGYGRYFNVFRYTDIEKGEGQWLGEVDTDKVGNLKWGANSTNGEPILVGNVLFQSAPTGEGRSDVSVFYKVLSNDPADYTPRKLSDGWTEIEISHVGSAYSSMTILPDGNLGVFYEEEPSGYSMVYVPLDLKEILPAEVYDALSAFPPTFSSEDEPVWHHLQFAASVHVLADQGAGNDVAAVEASDDEATQWILVGNRNAFSLKSMLGNFLAYDANANRYTTSSNEADKVALALQCNVQGSWELVREGADKKSLSEIQMIRSVRGAVGDAAICGEANQVLFFDLTPEVYDPNIFSTEENPVWYQVQFKKEGAYLADQGNGNNVKTAAAAEVDAQYWQFIGTPENFVMKSRLGNYILYKGERFATSATEKTELDVFKSGEGYYEIGRTTTSAGFNQWSGAGVGKEIGEYNAGDQGNVLRFILASINTAIEHMEPAANSHQPTAIYDLMGRRVSTMSKGCLYIVGGRKVVR